MLKNLMAVAIVCGLAVLSFRGFLTPGTAVGDRVQTGLTYVTLSQFLAGYPAAQQVVLYDEGAFAVDPAWYVIEDLAAQGDAVLGQRDGAQGAENCTTDLARAGKHIWILREGDAVVHIGVCDRRRMDIAALIAVARPLSVEQAQRMAQTLRAAGF